MITTLLRNRSRLLLGALCGVIACGDPPSSGSYVGTPVPPPLNFALACDVKIQVCGDVWVWSILPNRISFCACPAATTGPYPLLPATALYDVQLGARGEVFRAAFPPPGRREALVPADHPAARRLAWQVDVGMALSDQARLASGIAAFRQQPLATRAAAFQSESAPTSWADVLLVLDAFGLGK